jgi:hypothetical protein
MHISLAPGVAAALALLAVIKAAKVVWIAARQPALFGETSPMSLYARLDALKERHALLESRIFDEDHRPQPDSEILSRLKIEKLQIKDEMERIRTSLH